MAPKFRPWRPTQETFRQGERDRAEKKLDPNRIAYEISAEAAAVLVHADKMGGKTIENVANGYVARHLVDKGCLRRLAGRKSRYQLTLRGEAVVEELRNRKSVDFLFTDRKPPEI